MKNILILILFSFINITFLGNLNAKEPIQNRMTWYNKTWTVPEQGRWSLHISDLPPNSECNFGDREFDPSIAIKKALEWTHENYLESETLLVKDVIIHKMGMGWEQCVYIVKVFNEEPWTSMEIGVSLDGTKVYEPEKY